MPHLLHEEEIMGCTFIQNFVILPVVSIFGCIHCKGSAGGILNNWAPGGPFCSYRSGGVTHHTQWREITFPRAARAPSAMLQTAANFTALQHRKTLYQSPAAGQLRSWWPSNMDICWREWESEREICLVSPWMTLRIAKIALLLQMTFGLLA